MLDDVAATGHERTGGHRKIKRYAQAHMLDGNRHLPVQLVRAVYGTAWGDGSSIEIVTHHSNPTHVPGGSSDSLEMHLARARLGTL